MRTRLALSAFGVLTLLAACSGLGGDDSTTEGGENDLVYVGAAATPGSTQIGLWAVPDQLGFFEEEGLEVTQELADGSTAALQVLASRSADVTNAGLVSIMSAVSTGVPVKGFAAVAQNYPWQVAVLEGSEIEEPADLKGKAIGVISLASESNMYIRAWLEENGLDPENDVSYVPVGTGAPALGALEGGEVEALALYTEMYAALENEGASLRYFDNPPLFDEQPSITMAATKDALSEQSDILERYGRAMYKGLLFAWANPEAATRIGYEYYPEKLPESGDPTERLVADTKVFEAWIASVMPESGDPMSWPPFGEVKPDVLAGVQEYGLSGGQLDQEVDLDEVWDGSLIEEINDFDRQAVLDLAENWSPESLEG